jgi:hypothetical protein
MTLGTHMNRGLLVDDGSEYYINVLILQNINTGGDVQYCSRTTVQFYE